MQYLSRLTCQSALDQVVRPPSRLAIIGSANCGRRVVVIIVAITVQLPRTRCTVQTRLGLRVGIGRVSCLLTDRLPGSRGGRTWWTLVSAMRHSVGHGVDRHSYLLVDFLTRNGAVIPRPQSLSLTAHAMTGASYCSTPCCSARPAHLGQHTLWQSQYVQQNRSQLTALSSHASQPVRVPQRLVGSTPLRLVVERYSLVQRAVFRHLSDERRQLLDAVASVWLRLGRGRAVAEVKCTFHLGLAASLRLRRGSFG